MPAVRIVVFGNLLHDRSRGTPGKLDFAIDHVRLQYLELVRLTTPGAGSQRT
jgi:hypothetical protein